MSVPASALPPLPFPSPPLALPLPSPLPLCHRRRRRRHVHNKSTAVQPPPPFPRPRLAVVYPNAPHHPPSVSHMMPGKTCTTQLYFFPLPFLLYLPHVLSIRQIPSFFFFFFFGCPYGHCRHVLLTIGLPAWPTYIHTHIPNIQSVAFSKKKR